MTVIHGATQCNIKDVGMYSFCGYKFQCDKDARRKIQPYGTARNRTEPRGAVRRIVPCGIDPVQLLF